MLNFSGIKNALLINPPTGRYMRDPRCQAPVDTRVAEPPRPPMDLAYIAAVLGKNGVSCTIRDYPAERKSWASYKRDLSSLNPDMIIITTTIPTLERDLFSLEIAKAYDREIFTVAKGPHLFYFDREIMHKDKNIDLMVWEESSIIFKELLEEESLYRIKGITFRYNGGVVKNEKRVNENYINELPLPARHLLNNALYRTPDTDEPIAFILTGMGCPYKCIFCNSGIVYGYSVHSRDIDSVVDEIEVCAKDFSIKNFFFRAETFTFDKEWTISLCKKILDRKLKIRWGANSRVDTIDEERLFWMKNSGCSVIGFGAETASREGLKGIGKNITPGQIKNAVSLCKRFDIESFLIFIIGFPWDTEKIIKDTIDFAIAANSSFIEVNIAFPFPGTSLYSLVKERGLFASDRLIGYDYSNPVVKTQTLSSDDLKRLRKKFLRDFYFRPGYILSTIKRLKSLRIGINYIRWALKFVINIFGRR
jgi:radical SAM superfamily enzyme YgiQ (UPF0313 family)